MVQLFHNFVKHPRMFKKSPLEIDPKDLGLILTFHMSWMVWFTHNPSKHPRGLIVGQDGRGAIWSS